jgi:hypothetical protein
MRNDFKKWLSKYSKDYIKTVLSYLDRYLLDYPIRDQKLEVEVKKILKILGGDKDEV